MKRTQMISAILHYRNVYLRPAVSGQYSWSTDMERMMILNIVRMIRNRPNKDILTILRDERDHAEERLIDCSEIFCNPAITKYYSMLYKTSEDILRYLHDIERRNR